MLFLLQERPVLENLNIDVQAYATLDITEQNAFQYLGGYFIKKCLLQHTCATCEKYAQENCDLTAATIYTHLRAFDASQSTFGSLFTSNLHFCEFLVSLGQNFSQIFPDMSIQTGVGQKIKKYLTDKINFDHPCQDFPKEYFFKLFVRVRIYYTLKFMNRDLKSQKLGEHPKVAILKHL